MSSNNNKLNHAAFNQDHSCFVCTQDKQFSVWNCDQMTKRFATTFEKPLGKVGYFI